MQSALQLIAAHEPLQFHSSTIFQMRFTNFVGHPFTVSLKMQKKRSAIFIASLWLNEVRDKKKQKIQEKKTTTTKQNELCWLNKIELNVTIWINLGKQSLFCSRLNTIFCFCWLIQKWKQKNPYRHCMMCQIEVREPIEANCSKQLSYLNANSKKHTATQAPLYCLFFFFFCFLFPPNMENRNASMHSKIIVYIRQASSIPMETCAHSLRTIAHENEVTIDMKTKYMYTIIE